MPTFNTIRTTLSLLLFFGVFSLQSFAQLGVTPGGTAAQLVNTLVGPGIVVSNPVLNCPNGAFGTFDGTNSNIGLGGGVLLTSGSAVVAIGPNNVPDAGLDNFAPGDVDLTILSGFPTFDACALEFDFMAFCDSIQIGYVFASEEYPEYVGQINDAFGFFISGPGFVGNQNIALIPGTPTPVTINNVNNILNNQYYVDNTFGATVQYDGFTTVLLARANVVPCATYHVKLVVADAVDGIFDSGVFLEQGGIRCSGTIIDLTASTNNAVSQDAIEGCVDGIFTITRSGDSTLADTMYFVIAGTATNGVDYTPLPTSIILPAFATTATINVTAFADLIPEGAESIQLILVDTICNTVVYDTATIFIQDPFEVTDIVTDLSCWEDSSGQINISMAGAGIAPYSFAWTGPNGYSNTVEDPANLHPGQYQVLVTDSAGCENVDTAIVNQPPPLQIGLVPTHINCNGGNNGAIDLWVTGGTPNLTYLWSNGAGTQDISGLIAGTYCVTVTDNNGCTAYGCITLAEPLAMSLSTTGFDISCNGANDGIAMASGSGGNGNFSYSWQPGGQTVDSIGGLGAGDYIVTLTDSSFNNNPIAIYYEDFDGFTPWTLNVLTGANGVDNNYWVINDNEGGVPPPGCGTGANGDSTLHITSVACPGCGAAYDAGGLCGVLFCPETNVRAESPSISTVGYNNLTLTFDFISNGDALLDNASVWYNAGGGWIQLNPSIKSPVCPTLQGQWAVASFALPAATWNNPNLRIGFNWTNNDDGLGSDPSVAINNVQITAPGPGNLVLCTLSDTVTINEPSPLTIGLTAIVPQCNGVNNGSINATVNGGNGNYSFLWQPGGQTTQNLTNLGAGTYVLTVTDTSLIPQGPGGPTPLFADDFDGLNNWTLNVPTGANGADNNFWVVNDNEGGVLPPGCGIGNNGDNTLHITSVFCPACGAAYDGGGLCGILFCPETNMRAESPAFSSVGYTNLSLNFDFISNGDGLIDNASVWYNAGLGWQLLAPSIKSPLCPGGQGQWTATTFALPPAAWGVPALQIGFNWTNNDDGVGFDPSIALNNVEVIGIAPGGGGGFVLCTASDSITLVIPNALVLTDSLVDVACNGDSTGYAGVAVSGGTLPYSYLWTPNGEISPALNNIPAGNYQVMVTDSAGCFDSLIMVVNEPPVLSGSVTGFDVSCNGGNDGVAIATAAGGTPPYLYSWDGGAVLNDTATGLSAGSHTVVITDSNGCQITLQITLNEPATLSLSLSGMNATCSGANDGSASAVVGGGQGNYSYEWQPGGQTTLSINNLAGGMYYFTLTDTAFSFNGPVLCTLTDSVFIDQPIPVVATMEDSVDVGCFGGNNGSATVSGNGGTGAGTYTYLWSTVPPQINPQAINLTAGYYFVIVTDAVGCSDTASVTINEPTQLTLTGHTYAVSCNGAGDGVAVMLAGGGTPPYQYGWNTVPPQLTDSATGLNGGPLVGGVTDDNGCFTSINLNVYEPPVLSVSAVFTDVTCFGANDGTATASGSGGNGNYSYNWMPGNLNGASITGLVPGTYTVTITDTTYGVVGAPFALCTSTAQVTIAEPPLMTLSFSSVNANCGQIDGYAIVVANNGFPFYSYQWNTLPPQFTDSAQVAPGTWMVTVTDGHGCQVSGSVTVGDNPPPTVVISDSTMPLCTGSADGTATAQGVGGAGGYTYQWNTVPPQSGATATGLSAGVTYTVTVTDAVNCTATTTVTLNDPPALVLAMTGYDVSCNGGNDGIAVVNVSGGTPGFPPYTYLWWNTPIPNLTDSATGLPAGTYSVWVTDGNGCTDSNTVTLTEPSGLNLSLSSTDVNCNGGNDGTAGVSVSGGHGNYSYVWMPGGMTTANITGLVAGTYTVTVTDTSYGTGGGAFGLCTSVAQVVITEPALLQVAMSSQNANCMQPDGNATVTPSGGTLPYIYSWNTVPVQVTATATGLVPGWYTVTVTDAHGCVESDSVEVGNNLPPTVAITSSTDASCNGGSDGSATALAQGGAGGYVYTWNTVPPQTGATASGLPAGTWTVTVTDAVNCSATADVIISEPTAISLVTVTTPVSCYGGSNGTATVTAAGGTPPYTYFWSTIPTQTTPIASNVSAGTIIVTVIDANGCIAKDTAIVGSPTDIVATITTSPVSCNGGNDGGASAAVVGGIPPYTYFWIPGGQVIPNPNNLPAGQHTLVVTDANGCTDTSLVTIMEPTPLSLSYTATPERCYVPGDDGTATVIATGATGPYTYSWNTNPVQITQTATGLAPGSYICTVTDDNGCTDEITAIVPEIPGPTVDIQAEGSFCEGDGGDTLLAIPGGGTAPYYYTWWCNNNQTPNCGLDSINDNDPVANPTVTTTYYVMVTDGNGCTSDTDSVVVVVLPKPIVDAGPDIFLCGDAAPCELIQASVSGAPGPFTYEWTPSSGLSNPNILTPCARPDSTTIYTLVAVSSNGCSSYSPTVDSLSSVVVEVAPIPVAEAGDDKNICLGDSVRLNGLGTGSGPTYHYEWSPSTGLSNDTIANPYASPTQTTDYILNVWSHGCPSYGDTVTVFVHTLPSTAITLPSDICQGDTVQLNGEAWGDPLSTFYNYNWTPAQYVVGSATVENPYVAPPTTTTFYMHVSSEWGCEAEDSIRVYVKSTPIAFAGNDTIICGGEEIMLNGTYYFHLTDSITNPNLINWSWSPNLYMDDPNLLRPTVDPPLSIAYTLTVTYNTCETSDEVVINVIPEIIASITADTTVICERDSVQLIGSGGSNAAHYDWTPAGSLSDATIFNPWASPTSTTTYTLIVSEGHCADTADITIDALPSPTASYVGSLTAGCVPFTVDMEENGVGGTAWIWDFGDGSPVANTTSVQHTYTAPGTYQVTLTSVNFGGCQSTVNSMLITVGDTANAEFTSNPNWPATIPLPGAEVEFTDQSILPTGWVWDFGDGSTSGAQNPSHNWQQEGTYYVTLMITDAIGCVSSVIHGPYVIVAPDLLIPNVFTPNGDGEFDRYLVNYTGNQPFFMQIFDRWGNLMFESNNKNEGWDGRNPNMGNAEMAEGTYFYTVRIADKDYSGYLTLMR